MPLVPGIISGVIVTSVIEPIVPMLRAAAGSTTAAREAALEMVWDYRPRTGEEFRLAAQIICFGMKALGALHDASMPGVPVAVMLQLLATANGLRRSEAGAQRKLDALQRTRQKVEEGASPRPAPEPMPELPDLPEPEPQPPEPRPLETQPAGGTGFDLEAARAQVLAQVAHTKALLWSRCGATASSHRTTRPTRLPCRRRRASAESARAPAASGPALACRPGLLTAEPAGTHTTPPRSRRLRPAARTDQTAAAPATERVRGTDPASDSSETLSDIAEHWPAPETKGG